MNFQAEIKKYFLPFLILVALIVVLLFATKKSPNSAPVSDEPTIKNGLIVQEVDKNQVPAKFPSDVPIESDAQILQNFNAITDDGRFQATRVFRTKKSLADNLSIYKNFLTESGFKVESTVNTPTYKMVTGTKGNTTIQASIDENSQSHAKTVNISYVEVAR